MSSAVLEVDGLGKCFGQDVVLKSASFAACRGSITTLMGRNGAGKSTLFRIAVGRVVADYGRVLFRGRFFRRPSLARMARKGLFFSDQDSALTPLFTVRDHLNAVADTFGAGGMARVINELDLEEVLDRRPGRISGGERKRTALGMAVLRDPCCLLMDEPFAAVAPRDRPLIASGLRTLRERGCAVVISGHDVDDLLAVSDEIIWVVAGTTHYLGPPEAARSHDQFRREYLGPRGAA
ncbi:MAG: ABC transporter ATP-binding protein [Gemmatimonadota bacterium]